VQLAGRAGRQPECPAQQQVDEGEEHGADLLLARGPILRNALAAPTIAGFCALQAARTTTFPWAPATGGSCKRRGTKRALVAIGNQVLTIAYHLLLDPDARFVDLGVDFHDRLHPQRRTRQLIRELEHLSGKKVTLHTAA
jgi:hypothetical protein